MPIDHTETAVLLLVFNRPDTTARVFAEIRKAQPKRLYIASDGPRASKPAEAGLCKEARAAAGPIDWDCQVKTLHREHNLGCKQAVSSSIDWFFENEEEGIILEDDCLPSPDFFPYCTELLQRFRDDKRIRHIGGSNFQFGNKRGEASYYFSRLSHVWGWASWRRAWKDYDKNISSFTPDEIANALNQIFAEPLIVDQWRKITSDLKQNKIDTWDYQWGLANFLQNGLSTIPNENLITNIGFGPDATHTHDPSAKYANIPAGSMAAVTHPSHFIPNIDADLFTLNYEFRIPEQRKSAAQKEQKSKQIKYQIKRWIAAHGGPSRWKNAGLL